VHQDDTNWANRTLVVKLLVSNVKKKIQRFLFTFFFVYKYLFSCRVLMAPELKRCSNLFTLLQTKTLFLVMCLPWFLVASGWVRAFTWHDNALWFYLQRIFLINAIARQEHRLLLLGGSWKRILLRWQISLMLRWSWQWRWRLKPKVCRSSISFLVLSELLCILLHHG